MKLTRKDIFVALAKNVPEPNGGEKLVPNPLGDLIEVGPTAQIFTRPKHPLTEDYITGRFG